MDYKLVIVFLIIAMTATFMVIVFYRRLVMLHQEVSHQRDEYEKLSKAKTRLFTIISHDMRGPLSNMMGLHQIINKRIRDNHPDTELEKLSTLLNDSSNQVHHLLDNLLAWASEEEGVLPYHPETLNILECLEETREIALPQALAKNIELVCKVEQHLNAHLDKNTFMTIIRNLIGNAIKFTPEHGRITISGAQSDTEVVIAVADTGIGIPKEKIDILFEVDGDKVRRGTNNEVGTGLGLKLVSDFVRLNHGTITVDSKVGRGTTIRIVFPLNQDVETREVPQPPSYTLKPTVLSTAQA